MKQKTSHIASLILVTLMSITVAKGAVTLADADSLWRFDMPGGSSVGSNVPLGQIVDSSGNGHVASSMTGSLTWATTPAQSNLGSPSTTGISFNPVVTSLNVGPTVVDAVNPATFTVSNGSVSGGSAILTRFVSCGTVEFQAAMIVSPMVMHGLRGMVILAPEWGIYSDYQESMKTRLV